MGFVVPAVVITLTSTVLVVVMKKVRIWSKHASIHIEVTLRSEVVWELQERKRCLVEQNFKGITGNGPRAFWLKIRFRFQVQLCLRKPKLDKRSFGRNFWFWFRLSIFSSWIFGSVKHSLGRNRWFQLNPLSSYYWVRIAPLRLMRFFNQRKDERLGFSKMPFNQRFFYQSPPIDCNLAFILKWIMDHVFKAHVSVQSNN